MKIAIRGQVFKLKFGGAGKGNDGICECKFRKRKIRIKKSLRGRRRLEAIFHEMIHGGLWDLSERAVKELSRDMAKATWRLGYREKR